MAILLIILIVVAAIVAKGIAVRRQEGSLATRLTPVQAKVTRRGDHPEIRYVPTSDEDTQRPGEREVFIYVGEWEYVVDGQTYEGRLEQASPVFAANQMPPARIQVFYDRENPAVSRLYPLADASKAKAWFIFAGVAGLVGGAIALVVEGGNQQARRR